MRSIMPTATVERAHLTLVSSLRAQGFAVEAPAARPQPAPQRGGPTREDKNFLERLFGIGE